MAWAWGEVLDDNELDRRLLDHPGLVVHPSSGGHGGTLACPQAGSLRSLKERHGANMRRVPTRGRGKAARQILSRAPKPRLPQVAYVSRPPRVTSPNPARSIAPPLCTCP